MQSRRVRNEDSGPRLFDLQCCIYNHEMDGESRRWQNLRVNVCEDVSVSRKDLSEQNPGGNV